MKLDKWDFSLKQILTYAFFGIVGLLALAVLMKLLPIGIMGFLFLAPPVYVLADAQERGVKRPMLWALFTLFTWVFGLLVYLLARPEPRSNTFCPHCGGETDLAFHNCPWCGESLAGVGSKCAKCALDLKPGWKFCPHCNSPATVAKPAATGETPGGTTAA